jgi:hypothetical protein
MGDFDRWAAERTPQISAPPNLVCIPSSDRAFAALVQHRLVGIRDASQFEDALRAIYPRVRVRRRELTGEPFETWYVYRDGIFLRP